MKKIIFILLISGVFAAPGFAQSSFSVQWSLGFGGTVNDLVSSTSLKGVTMEYKMFPQPNISIGIDATWNHFYERRPYDTYTNGTLSLTGVQYRYANAVPIFLTTTFYLQPGEKLNPFIGAGVGTLFLSRYVDMGAYRVLIDGWHFALKPELGVLVNANPEMDIILGFRYNYGFEKSESEIAAQGYMAFNVGFVWK